eukprot:1139657-Pelagomonas_calceolata.AAC.3
MDVHSLWVQRTKHRIQGTGRRLSIQKNGCAQPLGSAYKAQDTRHRTTTFHPDEWMCTTSGIQGAGYIYEVQDAETPDAWTCTNSGFKTQGTWHKVQRAKSLLRVRLWTMDAEAPA